MSIQFEIPRSIEEKLRENLRDLPRAGKEAMLVEFYRQGQISHHELAQSLGLTRFETDALLKHHRVTEDLLSDEELQNETEMLARLLN